MIEAVGLVKRVGPLEILRGVSVRVEAGEIAAIVGPSGGGKSTLLRCLNGLETFDRGSVEVDGLKVEAGGSARGRSKTFHQIRLKVGMVFQAFHLFPHRSVLENVTEGPRCVLGLGRDEAVARALRLLDRVGLSDKVDAAPRQLSGGQQQRVAIARALAMEPRAILFDEPTSALDPRMTGEVLSILNDLASDGLTMVVVTHAIPFALEVARTVHVVAEGRVVESGRPADLVENPEHPITRSVLAEIRHKPSPRPRPISPTIPLANPREVG